MDTLQCWSANCIKWSFIYYQGKWRWKTIAYRAFSSGLGDSVSSREFCRDYIFAKPTQSNRTSVLEDEEKIVRKIGCNLKWFSPHQIGESGDKQNNSRTKMEAIPELVSVLGRASIPESCWLHHPENQTLVSVQKLLEILQTTVQWKLLTLHSMKPPQF